VAWEIRLEMACTNGNNNLLRKYIYGPGIDQPVSMIEVDDNNAAYYQHFDGLGSVVALSDSTGGTPLGIADATYRPTNIASTAKSGLQTRTPPRSPHIGPLTGCGRREYAADYIFHKRIIFLPAVCGGL